MSLLDKTIQLQSIVFHIIQDKIYSFLFPPNHFIHDSSVALDKLNHFGRHIFIRIIWHRDTIVTINVHLHGCIYGLEQRTLINAGKDKAPFIHCLGAFCRRAYTHCRERMSDRCENELSSGNVPESETTANAFICKQL